MEWSVSILLQYNYNENHSKFNAGNLNMYIVLYIQWCLCSHKFLHHVHVAIVHCYMKGSISIWLGNARLGLVVNEKLHNCFVTIFSSNSERSVPTLYKNRFGVLKP